MDETVKYAGTTLALFFLGAFVIDRLARNLVLGLELLPAWTKRFPGEQVQKAGTLTYFLVAAIFGVALAGAVPGMRILARVGATVDSVFLTALINGLVLTGGADVVKTLLGYLEDRRVLQVARRNDPVEISIVNKHDGPVEVHTADGKLVGATRTRGAALTEKGPH